MGQRHTQQLGCLCRVDDDTGAIGKGPLRPVVVIQLAYVIGTHRALKLRAAQHGRSTEEEIGRSLGGVELDLKRDPRPIEPAPNPAVLGWLNAQEPQTLYLTTINLAELLAGGEALPAGRQRDTLAQALSTQVLSLFEG